MTKASPPRLILPPRGSAVTLKLRFARYLSRATENLGQLAFFRRFCFVVFLLAELRRPDDLLRAGPRDLPPFSPTLRRSASIRLITLDALGSGGAGGSLPARFALISAESAS